MKVPFTQNHCEEILENLVYVRVNCDTKFSTVGLCNAIHSLLHIHSFTYGLRKNIMCFTRELWCEWHKYSGDRCFPISVGEHSPQDQYTEAYFMWEGKYGRARKYLLAYLVDCYEEILHSPNTIWTK